MGLYCLVFEIWPMTDTGRMISRRWQPTHIWSLTRTNYIKTDSDRAFVARRAFSVDSRIFANFNIISRTSFSVELRKCATKSIKIVATRCPILRLKCIKFDLGWGSTPNPADWAYSTRLLPRWLGWAFTASLSNLTPHAFSISRYFLYIIYFFISCLLA